VNFSRDFIDNANMGTAGESMIIHGIVNTLTSLPDIQQVRFLVEGTVRPTYIHAVFDEPFVRNEGIITYKMD
jgi:spore germination protein GerM